MRRSRTPVILAALLLGFVALGAFQGRNLQELRDAEIFYRWLHSMASDLFLRGGTSGDGEELAALRGGMEEDTRDYALLATIIQKTVPLLGGSSALESARLIEMINSGTHDREVWELATSHDLAEERAAFQAYRDADELLYARNIDLANAQSSGVNLFNLFFGFRKVAANFVWMQVDQYWHMGMEHRMLPLMKTTVTLDPNFIDAYLVGAWHLAYNLTAKMEETPPEEKRWLQEHEALVGPKEEFYYLAVDYLEDGIRNNPRNYKLYFDLGFAVYKEKIQDYANAVRHLERAVSLPHERWVPRQLYICYELNGQYDRAQQGWERYLNEFPDNVTAPRFIERNKGLMREEEGDALLAASRAEEHPEAAQALRDQAMSAYEEARGIFGALVEDSYGEARASMIDSKLLAIEGRYVEAIALLEYARLASGFAFLEASTLLMDFKREAGIPLSLSEQMELERQRDYARVLAQAQEAAAQSQDGAGAGE